MVQVPDQEPCDFGVLRVAGEDGRRILGSNRAQDQARSIGSAQQRRENRIEALAAGGGGREPLVVEGQKTAIDQQR